MSPGAGPNVGPDPGILPEPDDAQNQLGSLETARIKVGPIPLTVHVANTPGTREKGLMHVRELPENEGMIFVYASAERRSFWMKNTFIPLSLAYIAEDGRIDQIVDLDPLSTCSNPSSTIVRFVLEVNKGWFQRNGVEVGAHVEGLNGLRGY